MTDTQERPYTPVSTARRAGLEARRFRAEHLLAVSDGQMTPTQLVERAADYDARALRRIRLTRLLTAQPGCGTAGADAILASLWHCLHGSPAAPEDRQEMRSWTVAWLLDTRSGGRRWAAWVDALTRTRVIEAPWPAFPYSLPISGAGGGGSHG